MGYPMCLSGYLDPYFDMELGHSRESSGVSAHVVREAHACVVSVPLPPIRRDDTVYGVCVRYIERRTLNPRMGEPRGGE